MIFLVSQFNEMSPVWAFGWMRISGVIALDYIFPNGWGRPSIWVGGASVESELQPTSVTLATSSAIAHGKKEPIRIERLLDVYVVQERG